MAGKIRRKEIIVILLILFIIIQVTFFIVKYFKNNNNSGVTRVELIEGELDLVYGSDTAQLSLFMFSSYQCSFCRKFLIEVYPEIKREFIDQGKLKLVIKPLVLSNNESLVNSVKLAVCINKYGNFDKLNQLLLTEPKVVYSDEFDNLIQELTEEDSFVAECFFGGKAENYIMKNIVEFNSLGLKGTPTFIINNKIYKGYKDLESMGKIIEKELQNTLH